MTMPAVFTFEEITTLAAFDVRQDRILQRAQACLCLQFLTGLRATPFVNLALGDVDLPARCVQVYCPAQDNGQNHIDATSRVVEFLILPALYPVVTRWVEYLRSELPKEVADLSKVFTVFDSTTRVPLAEAPIDRNRHVALSNAYECLCQEAGITAKGTEAVRRAHDDVFWTCTNDAAPRSVLQRLDQMPTRDKRALASIFRYLPL